MKKILISLFLCMFLFSTLAIAGTPSLPYTLNGKVSLESGECLTGFDIKLNAITNPWTSEVIEVLIPVNENCEYNFVLGNSPFSNWGNGMKLNLIFCNEDINEHCKKVLTIGETCPSDGGCPYDFVYKSNDKVIIKDREVIVTETIREEEEDGWWNVWYTILSSLIGLVAIVLGYFKWGPGFKGLINYRLRLASEAKARGDKKEAMKQLDIATRMSKTVLKNYKLGKYDK